MFKNVFAVILYSKGNFFNFGNWGLPQNVFNKPLEIVESFLTPDNQENKGSNVGNRGNFWDFFQREDEENRNHNRNNQGSHNYGNDNDDDDDEQGEKVTLFPCHNRLLRAVRVEGGPYRRSKNWKGVINVKKTRWSPVPLTITLIFDFPTRIIVVC